MSGPSTPQTRRADLAVRQAAGGLRLEQLQWVLDGDFAQIKHALMSNADDVVERYQLRVENAKLIMGWAASTESLPVVRLLGEIFQESPKELKALQHVALTEASKFGACEVITLVLPWGKHTNSEAFYLIAAAEHQQDKVMTLLLGHIESPPTCLSHLLSWNEFHLHAPGSRIFHAAQNLFAQMSTELATDFLNDPAPATHARNLDRLRPVFQSHIADRQARQIAQCTPIATASAHKPRF